MFPTEIFHFFDCKLLYTLPSAPGTSWRLNGQCRDLVAQQRALIWKYCQEQSELWQAEQRRIQEKANRKRSEVMQGVAYASKGERRKPEKVAGQSDPQPSDKDRHPSRQAQAAAAGVSTSTMKRAKTLKNKRPDLAEKVRAGEHLAHAAKAASGGGVRPSQQPKMGSGRHKPVKRPGVFSGRVNPEQPVDELLGEPVTMEANEG